MIELYAATGVGGLLRYLRGHAEATAHDARESPELRAELLHRCFGAAPGFKYDKDKRGTDRWFNFAAALHHLQCQVGSGPPRICCDCEDLCAYFLGAALALDCFAWCEVGIIPPPARGKDGHAIGRVGPLVSRPPAGLLMPGPGIWDPSVWTGMGEPESHLYSTAEFLRLRSD